MIGTYSLSYFYIAYTLSYFTVFGSSFLNVYYGLPLYGVGRVLYIAIIAIGAAFGVLLTKFVIWKYPKRYLLI